MQVAGLFDVADDLKRSLLQQLGVLHSLQEDDLSLQDLLLSTRVHCLSKAGGAGDWHVGCRSPLGTPWK